MAEASGGQRSSRLQDMEEPRYKAGPGDVASLRSTDLYFMAKPVLFAGEKRCEPPWGDLPAGRMVTDAVFSWISKPSGAARLVFPVPTLLS